MALGIFGLAICNEKTQKLTDKRKTQLTQKRKRQLPSESNNRRQEKQKNTVPTHKEEAVNINTQKNTPLVCQRTCSFGVP